MDREGEDRKRDRLEEAHETMTRHGQNDSRKRYRCRGDEMGMEEVQGRQRNRKKGINQHRFH